MKSLVDAQGVPYKLLLVSTGNVSNSTLERLFLNNLDAMVAGSETYVFTELDRTTIRSHF